MALGNNCDLAYYQPACSKLLKTGQNLQKISQPLFHYGKFILHLQRQLLLTTYHGDYDRLFSMSFSEGSDLITTSQDGCISMRRIVSDQQLVAAGYLAPIYTGPSHPI